MTSYLSYTFTDSEAFVSTFDELPLWSAPFGQLLLQHIPMKPGMVVIDIGSGAGFPLIELASRLGSTCKLYGIDPWTNAQARAAQKITNYGITNVELMNISAEHIPLANNTVDLVVSNLGINNFSNPKLVFTECYRVLKPGGNLALTTNLMGHWHLFYRIFEDTLHALGRQHLIPILKNDEEHRGTVDTVSTLFTSNGFSITKVETQQFDMRFVDGSAFLNHHFIKLGWLTTWMNIFPQDELHDIFHALEQNLDEHAARTGELRLAVPMAYIEGVKT